MGRRMGTGRNRERSDFVLIVAVFCYVCALFFLIYLIHLASGVVYGHCTCSGTETESKSLMRQIDERLYKDR